MADEIDLSGFSGSESLYPHWTRKLVYTDGVKYLAEVAGAYWLLDAIASYQTSPGLVAMEPFQTWTLSRTTGTAAVLEMTDGNSRRAIVRQEIEFTDFPLQQVELYLTQGCLMLPSEY